MVVEDSYLSPSDLIFSPTGDKVWTATKKDCTISIQLLRFGVCKVASGEREKSFDDFHEAVQYIVGISGQRPMFRTDDMTANVRTTC